MKTTALVFLLLIMAPWNQLHANVVGNGLQNFNTIPSGLDFVTVHSSETLKPGIVNLGLFLNQAYNSLPYFEGQAQSRSQFNDRILGMDLNIGLGLSENWDVGISAPFMLHQSVDADAPYHGEFGRTGNTEVRFATKYRFWGDDSGGLAGIFSTNINRTLNNPYMGIDSGPTMNFELAWDTTIQKWAVGANLGYRKTNPGTKVPGSVIEPLADQVIGGVAASYLLPRVDTKLIFEVFGSLPAQSRSSNPDRNASSLELLGGVKHDWNTNLALHAGAGTELMHGVSSPDWRLYVGVNYTFGPIFKPRSPTERVVRGPEERLIVRNILFEFDSDKIKSESESIIDEIYDGLKDAGFIKIRILGHTDSIGSEEYNANLSLRRAQAIRRYLIQSRGVDGAKIEAEGRGESEPVADNGNFQGREQNRRVEFIVTH